MPVAPPIESHRLVAAALKVAEYHHTAQVADMQRVGSRVKTDVGCDLFFYCQFFGARHHVVEHAAPSQFFYEIHRFKFVFVVILSYKITHYPCNYPLIRRKLSCASFCNCR